MNHASYFKETSGDYIFQIIDLINTKVEHSPNTLYTNLRGIFLRNLRHDEKLALSHEDFILFYVLTVLHPDLSVFIKDKYNEKLSYKRILDFKAEILADAEGFLSTNQKLEADSKVIDKLKKKTLVSFFFTSN